MGTNCAKKGEDGEMTFPSPSLMYRSRKSTTDGGIPTSMGGREELRAMLTLKGAGQDPGTAYGGGRIQEEGVEGGRKSRKVG